MIPLTTDQRKGRVEIEVDGEKRYLRYTHESLSRLVDVLELSGLTDVPSAVTTLDVDTLRAFLWTGLLHENADLKIEDIGSMFVAVVPTYACVVEALNLAFWGRPDGPEEVSEDDAADPPKAAESGTSKRRKNSRSDSSGSDSKSSGGELLPN